MSLSVVRIELVPIVFESVIFFLQQFLVYHFSPAGAELLHPRIVDKLISIFLFEVFKVMHSFGIVSNRGRKLAIQSHPILCAKYSSVVSMKRGMIPLRRGHESSRHGFVLISMR